MMTTDTPLVTLGEVVQDLRAMQGGPIYRQIGSIFVLNPEARDLREKLGHQIAADNGISYETECPPLETPLSEEALYLYALLLRLAEEAPQC